jgi:hypothetical protein
MMQRRIATLGAAVLLAAGLALPITYAVGAENVDILQKVQTAKTPADHEAIAAYYEQQAAAAKKNADMHRQMAETYKGGGTAIGKGSGATAMPQHCQNLAKSFDEEAAQYAAMAQVHRELAKSAK